MFRFTILALGVIVFVALGIASQPSSPPPVLEAGHCIFWRCSTTGELLPTQATCLGECAGGSCTPVDTCQ